MGVRTTWGPDPAGLGRGLSVCISNKLFAAAAAGPWATLGEMAGTASETWLDPTAGSECQEAP